MASNLKTQIEITADAAGVEAGVGKAKRSLADLGASAAASGRQAGAGLSSIGAGGDMAATRVDRSTQRMIDSIQRTTIALESGGKSSAKYFETIASQKGLNADALKPYIDSLAAAEMRQKSLNSAIEKTKSVAAQVGAAFGATLTVGFLKGLIDDAVSSRVELLRLARVAGDSVESLSALGRVGKLSGTALDQITAATIRFNKGLISTEEGSKDQARAIEALGLSYNKLKNATPTEQLQQVAKAFEGFEDGAGKATAAVLLYGKQGAELLPFLRDLAQQQTLVSKVTAESALQAEQYSRNLSSIQAASEDWKKAISENVIPVIARATEQLIDGRKAFGGFFAAIGGIGLGVDPAKSIAESLGGVREELDRIEPTLEKIRKNNAAGGFTKFLFGGDESILAIRVDQLQKLKNYLTSQQTREALSGTAGQVLDRFDRRQRLSIEPSTARAAATGAVREKADDYARLLRQVTELKATTEAAAEGENKLTEAQRLGARIAADYTDKLIKITPAQLAELNAKLASASATEKLRQARERDAKWAEEATAENNLFVEGLRRQRDTYEDVADKAAAALGTYNLSTAALEALEVARQRDAAAALVQRAALADSAYLKEISDLYLQQASALTAAADARQRFNDIASSPLAGAQLALTNYVSQAERAGQQTQHVFERAFGGIEDALVSLTTTGKADFKSLANSIISDIYRMMIQAQIAGLLKAGGAGSSGGFSFSGLATYFNGGSAGQASNSYGGDVGLAYGKSSGPQIASVPSSITKSAGTGKAVAPVTVNVKNEAGHVTTATAQQNSSGEIEVMVREIARDEQRRGARPGGSIRQGLRQLPPKRG